ncbi:hypothetical protein JYU05_01000 [bacterium AH-315-P13]|nr:hypothetical protein [bacterium AH-315-P13]MBN4084805.1 hypothetical protein [Flavobacteriaceae bacterium AH-315-B10]
MKKVIALFVFSFFLLSCSSQEILVRNLDYNSEMNYIFSRINPTTIYKEGLYNGGVFVTVYKMSDSKTTPEDYSEGHEFLSSLIISVTPDGDYYSYSKLYKIEGLIIPKVLEIKETTAPNFSVKIEHGSYRDNKRKTKTFNFKGVQ